MPKVFKPDSTITENRPAGAKPSENGKPKSALAEALSRLKESGTEDIAIGSTSPIPDEILGATMADAAKVVAGIKYLLRGWMPFGQITGLIAEPGIGKSAFALYGIVRPITTSHAWFNGMPGPATPGKVLWCANENDMAITLDRVRQWGLPMDRIILPFADDPLRPINLTDEEHLRLIEALVNRHQTKAVIIDSLRGGHDGDENSSRVGGVLQSLAAIAERTNAAFVVVHHTRKLMVDEEVTANSSRGSNAIFALMRVQIGLDRPDPESKWVRLRMLKRNLPVDPKPVGFRIADKGLEFGPAPLRPRKDTRKQDAEDWLQKRMEPGKWYRAKEVLGDAKRFGFSDNAVQRAREELGITTTTGNIRQGVDGSEWRCPTVGG